MESIMNSQAVQNFLQHWAMWPDWIKWGLLAGVMFLLLLLVSGLFQRKAEKEVLGEISSNEEVREVSEELFRDLMKLIAIQQKQHHEQMLDIINEKKTTPITINADEE